jgi:hypothetical protein
MKKKAVATAPKAMKAMKRMMKKKAAAPAPKAMKAMKKAIRKKVAVAAALAPKVMRSTEEGHEEGDEEEGSGTGRIR